MSGHLRLSHVSIKRLFGMYDHEFYLNELDRVTIIHGPNGVGKTVLLKSIYSVFSGHYSYIRNAPFESIGMKFSDNSHLSISRRVVAAVDGRSLNRQKVELEVEFRSAGSKQNFLIKPSADIERMARMVEQNSPFIHQTADNVWYDRRSGRTYSSEELVESNQEFFTKGRMARVLEAEPQPLQELRKSIRVNFIETDRLTGASDDGLEFGVTSRRTAAVNSYARQLQKHIEATLARYGRNAQQLDQSFPRRLIQDKTPKMELVELKRRMEVLEARQK